MCLAPFSLATTLPLHPASFTWACAEMSPPNRSITCMRWAWDGSAGYGWQCWLWMAWHGYGWQCWLWMGWHGYRWQCWLCVYGLRTDARTMHTHESTRVLSSLSTQDHPDQEVDCLCLHCHCLPPLSLHPLLLSPSSVTDGHDTVTAMITQGRGYGGGTGESAALSAAQPRVAA